MLTDTQAQHIAAIARDMWNTRYETWDHNNTDGYYDYYAAYGTASNAIAKSGIEISNYTAHYASGDIARQLLAIAHSTHRFYSS